MSDEIQAATNETAQPAVNESTVNETVNESPSQETTEASSDDSYEWVPKKYMRDGKPDFQAIEKARANLEKKLSQKGVAIAPETPDAYAYELTSLPVDEEASNAFKQEALQAGLSVEQYEFIMKKYEDNVGQFVHTAEKAERTLKEAWGNEYAQNMAYANRAFEEYVPSDVSLDEIGNNPAIIKILARIGAELGEDTAPARSSVGSNYTQADIEKLMSSPEYGMAGSEARQTVDAWFKKQYG